MYKKKLIVKPLFQGFCLPLLSIILLSSCFFPIFNEKTFIEYDLYNHSSADILVVFSTIKSEGIDSIIVFSHIESRIYTHELEGHQDKPTIDEFSSYLKYFKIFVNDTLVYSQNPTDMSQWNADRDHFDDEMIWYNYQFNVTDSLITHD
ncbi:MAG: hypothetical protein WC703_08635 [Candidatus Neomarinimicrobiota bacterium]